MRSTAIEASILAVLALSASSVVGHAQGIDIGKSEYVNSCASCHGVAGNGDGPVAKSLKQPPADLTKLSQSNFGVFPFSRVYDVIDGRFEVATHGQREMPVWGAIYQPSSNATPSAAFPYAVPKEVADAVARGRILALIDYIFTLQAK